MQFCPALQAAGFHPFSNTSESRYGVREGQGSICPDQQSSCRVGVQTLNLERSGYEKFISALTHSKKRTIMATALGLTICKSHLSGDGCQPFCPDQPPLGIWEAACIEVKGRLWGQPS